MSTNQFRLNPSQPVPNLKGRHDLPRAWPSSAVSTWHNGGLFGASKFEMTSTTNVSHTNTHSDITRYTWDSDGSFVCKAGYVDIFMIGGGGAGSQGGTGQLGGGGGAGGVLYLEDVYIEAGTWNVDVGASGSDSFIYGSGGITDPLTDDRMDSHGTAKSDKAVSAGFGGNSSGNNGGTSGGDHCQTASQQGSGAGGGSGATLGAGGSAGTGGASGDIGYNGRNGIASSGYWGGGAGGGAGGLGSSNSSYGGSFTDGGDGVQNTYVDGSTTVAYAVGGSADLWTEYWVSTDRKNDNAVYEDVGGHSAWQTNDADNNGAVNTGSGGGGGYTYEGVGGSGIVIIMTRAEDA